MEQPLWKVVWQFLPKLTILSLQSSNHSLWYFLKRVKNKFPKKSETLLTAIVNVSFLISIVHQRAIYSVLDSGALQKVFSPMGVYSIGDSVGIRDLEPAILPSCWSNSSLHGLQYIGNIYQNNHMLGFSSGLMVKESAYQCRGHRSLLFDPWVWKISCRRKWQPILRILVWTIPWTGDPEGEHDNTLQYSFLENPHGGVQSMESKRVGHD